MIEFSKSLIAQSKIGGQMTLLPSAGSEFTRMRTCWRAYAGVPGSAGALAIPGGSGGCAMAEPAHAHAHST